MLTWVVWVWAVLGRYGSEGVGGEGIGGEGMDGEGVGSEAGLVERGKKKWCHFDDW